jgi:hypothetical protein
MKKITTLALILGFGLTQINAQGNEIRTLFKGNTEIRVGGYGGFEMKSTQLDKNFTGLLLGMRGGMVVNDQFLIGAAGYGLLPTKKVNYPNFGHNTEENHFLTGGYGGLFFEYIHHSDRMIHLTANTLIGCGGITLARGWGNNNPNFDNTFKHPSSFVFVIEPGIALDVNVTKMFRMSLGISYRYTPNFNLQYEGKDIVSSTAFNGLAVGLTFKFGSFSGRPYREVKEKHTPVINVPTPTIVR